MLKDSPTRYGALSKCFHWTLTLLIIGMLTLGWVMNTLPEHSPLRGTLVGIHMSTGVLTLALAVLFVLWRLINPRPSLAELPGWQRYLAGTTHFLLFAILLAQPLAGIIMAMAGGHHVSFYGLFNLPIWTPKSKPLAGGAHSAHTDVIPWVIVGLLVVHTLGAFYHQFVRKDLIMQRMLPGRTRPQTDKA